MQWSGASERASERGAKRERVGEERSGGEWERSGVEKGPPEKRSERETVCWASTMALTVLTKVREPGYVVRIGLVTDLDL